MKAATAQLGGSSDDVFGNFAEPVYGTAGSAQAVGQRDAAWYAGHVRAVLLTSCDVLLGAP